MRHRVRVISFSVHCRGKKQWNKKVPVHVDLLTPSLSTQERLLHRHIEPGLSSRVGSSMSNKRHLYSASSCPMWCSKHCYTLP